MAIVGAIRGMLFDLDGTLADTAPDMAGALNALRLENRLEPLPYERIRPHVSHGASALIKLGFGEALDVDRHSALRERFLHLYASTLCRESRVFPGVEAVLDGLQRSGIAWGIVTNKPGWLAGPLIARLGLEDRSGCLVSGDSVPRRKPDPLPLIHAAGLLGLRPSECVYVGDAERDIVAGRAAGMPTLVAGWGYLGEHDRPEHWGAEAVVATPEELIGWLDDAAAAQGVQHVR